MIRGSANARRAITLNELVAVILVAVVLAGIAVLSTRVIISSTKYSRVKEDHRVLARALENYRMDYSSLPAADSHLTPLARPTAYISQVPTDPFRPGRGDEPYLYLRPQMPGVAFLLISTGPDGDYDLPPELVAMVEVPEEALRLVQPQAKALDLLGDPIGPRAPTPSLRLAGARQDQFDQETLAQLGFLPPTGQDPSPSSRAALRSSQAQEVLSLIQRYVETRSWTPRSETLDGDVITIYRY